MSLCYNVFQCINLLQYETVKVPYPADPGNLKATIDADEKAAVSICLIMSCVILKGQNTISSS